MLPHFPQLQTADRSPSDFQMKLKEFVQADISFYIYLNSENKTNSSIYLLLWNKHQAMNLQANGQLLFLS